MADPPSGGGPLAALRPAPGGLAARDVQDLMAYPFFSLSKTPRIRPIDYRSGGVVIRVEAVAEYGMATIWDADVLIWAASQIVEARDQGLATSRLMSATPYEILRFIGRGSSVRDYLRIKAAFDRLQSTTIATSIRQVSERRIHRFSWLNEWKERLDREGRPLGVELILPDWFYAAATDERLVLTIDRGYFALAGGLERWLYRVVRKHGGRQAFGWRFEFRHLHQKSGALSPFKRFAFELRDIVRRQSLPGYQLFLEVDTAGRVFLAFEPSAPRQPVDGFVLSGTGAIVPSGTAPPCYQEPAKGLSLGGDEQIRSPNLDSNQASNSSVGLRSRRSGSAVSNLSAKHCRNGGRR